MKLRTVHKTIRKMMSGTEGPERSALRTACACIEKSIPKKVMRIEISEEPERYNPFYGNCPTCKKMVTCMDFYCPSCGQRIKWDEKR
ncbi:hypothetical protein DW819_08615 [Clostridium sp. AM33-3]|nr:hypothetical protein DW819_08615 [Clostridium sp. AM33-3]